MNKLRSAIVLSIISLPACGQESSGQTSGASDSLGPGEVAIVGDDRIPESVFRLFALNSLQTSADNLPPDVRGQVIDRLVVAKLLATEAERNGLHRERRIAAELELQRMQLLARHMSSRHAEENPPSEAELRDLYQESLPQLGVTQYKTRHILVDTEEDARTVLSELDSGEEFADLALQFSTGPTAAEGGDLGWITAESVVAPFGDAVASATPGVPVPDPVESEYGWHVILVEEVRESAPPGLESVRQDLVAAVQARKLSEFLRTLREEVGVEVLE